MSDEFRRPGGSSKIRDDLFVARDTVDEDTRELYEFGPFRLEPAERKLLRGNEVVVLTPKAFDTLVLLVRNNGHLQNKEKLLRTLWPDSFVEEGNLSNNIFLLRKALGDDPGYIETVPKRGYRFVGAVRQFPRAEERLAQQREFARAISIDPHSSEQLVSGVPASARRGKHALAVIAATALAILAIGAGLWWANSARLPHHSQWIQLTKFPDSAFHPALSPDGRMLAFIRRVDGIGQVYVKMLPDGEPVQLTRDKLPKSDPAFSPAGSRVAYTTLDPQTFAWDTWVVPTLGGEPQPCSEMLLAWSGPARGKCCSRRSRLVSTWES